jgi:hypothetical protein
MSFLDKYAEQIRKRKPFSSVQLMGYRTRGGTYILASPKGVNDDDRAHDLLAVLPDDTVIPLRYNSNPHPVRELLRKVPS